MTRTTSFCSSRARFYRRYTLQYCRDHAFILGLGALYLLGIWMGARIIGNMEPDLVENLVTMLSGFVVERSAQSIQQTMLWAFLSSFWMLAYLFICGFCAISMPLILMTPVFKGMGFGLTAASMIGLYGTAAIPYIGLLLLPNAVCSALVTLFACKESLRLSSRFFGLLKGEKGEEGGVRVTFYCARFVVLLLLLVLGAAMEGILFSTFGGSLTPLI